MPAATATVRITAGGILAPVTRDRFLVATASAMLGYGVMNLVMLKD